MTSRPSSQRRSRQPLVQRLRVPRASARSTTAGLEANPFDAMFGRGGGRHGRGGMPRPGLGGRSNESGVDLPYLVEKLELGDEDRAETDKLAGGLRGSGQRRLPPAV